jgi:hypothetical protein
MHIGYSVVAGLDPAIHVLLNKIPGCRLARPEMIE